MDGKQRDMTIGGPYDEIFKGCDYTVNWHARACVCMAACNGMTAPQFDVDALQAANARLTSLLAATAGECAAWRNVPDLMTKSEGGCDDSTNYAVTMQCKCESCKVTLPALQATDAALLAAGTTLGELAGACPNSKPGKDCPMGCKCDDKEGE